MQELERAKRVAIVAAHPDDEVIGAGGLIAWLREVYVIHTTDGSPLDLSDALKNGFATREEYAVARRAEVADALQMAGVPRSNVIPLGFTDRETMHCLPALCGALDRELSGLKPDIILTQPYEGGHPDHDSTAFAVDYCARSGQPVFEMTSYHSRHGVFTTGKFLAGATLETVRELSPEDRERKQQMMACFRSQASVLQQFPIVAERFRRAPRYNFTKPPHTGLLHYEQLHWGITGEAWRALAAQCL